MFYSVISIFVKCLILSSMKNAVDKCYWNNQYVNEELEFAVNYITEFCSAKWLVISGCAWMILGIITDCMQFVDRILLEWFVFIDSRFIEWIWVECAKIACHGDWSWQDR